MVIFFLMLTYHPGQQHTSIPAAPRLRKSPRWWLVGKREPCCSPCCDQWEPSRLERWCWTEKTVSSTRQKWHQWTRGAPARVAKVKHSCHWTQPPPWRCRLKRMQEVSPTTKMGSLAAEWAKALVPFRKECTRLWRLLTDSSSSPSGFSKPSRAFLSVIIIYSLQITIKLMIQSMVKLRYTWSWRRSWWNMEGCQSLWFQGSSWRHSCWAERCSRPPWCPSGWSPHSCRYRVSPGGCSHPSCRMQQFLTTQSLLKLEIQWWINHADLLQTTPHLENLDWLLMREGLLGFLPPSIESVQTSHSLWPVAKFQ